MHEGLSVLELGFYLLLRLHAPGRLAPRHALAVARGVLAKPSLGGCQWPAAEQPSLGSLLKLLLAPSVSLKLDLIN